ncbi:MAG TPA: hypothetical protein VGQ13_08955 [Nitrososphaera sp.]|nr:hypothetical protein [Nitrososphaera sp.]
MSSGDIPPEVIPPSSSDTGLHSFTKLAIAYIGILLGLTIISVTLGAVVTLDNRSNPISLTRDNNYLVAYYVVLIPMMLAAVELLRKGKKLGAYLAFASMAVHYSIYFPTILFLITSPIVGILLWRSFRYLR